MVGNEGPVEVEDGNKEETDCFSGSGLGASGLHCASSLGASGSATYAGSEMLGAFGSKIPALGTSKPYAQCDSEHQGRPNLTQNLV